MRAIGATKLGCVRGALLAMFALARLPAAGAPVPLPPDARAVWIPVTELERVLERHPRAVVLSAEQYRRLLDESRAPAPERPAPRAAVVTDALLEITPLGEAAVVDATYTVRPFTERWVAIPITLPAKVAGEVRVEGSIALYRPDGSDGYSVLVRGPAPCTLAVRSVLPVRREKGLSRLEFSNPDAARALVRLTLPPHCSVQCADPTQVERTPHATIAEITPGAGSRVCQAAWQPDTRIPAGAVFLLQECAFLYTIDESRVHADLGLVIDATIGHLPPQVAIRIPPSARVTRVEGNDVASWTLRDGVVAVTLTPGRRRHAAIRLLTESPALGADVRAGAVSLPLAAVHEAGRASGKLAIVGSAGVRLRELDVRAPAIRLDGAYGDAVARWPHFTAAFAFASLPPPPAVSVERSGTRYRAEIDTAVDFLLDAIRFQRSLTLAVEERELFDLAIALPSEESVTALESIDGAALDWRIEDHAIRVRFADGIAAGRTARLKISSRRVPAVWPPTDGKPFALALRPVPLPGAAHVSGYLALKADPSLRLQASKSAGLESRDGRTTPVAGDLAWLHREQYAVDLTVTRRAPEIEARLAGVLLPTSSAIELVAQLDLEVRFAGAKFLRIRVPGGGARLFHFDGADIAERNLEGDIWTLRFQKEILGNHRLGVRALLPLALDQERRFAVVIPEVIPLETRHASGTWVVEANTEIEFEHEGLAAVDLLQAPAVAGHTPRHRVVGVFEYPTHPHRLVLRGTRHEPAKLATAVVDSIDLESVLAPNGAPRHLARLALRNAGEQFLEIQLPPDAHLWSMRVDGEPTKPVASPSGAVRVRLPTHVDPGRSIEASLLYETGACDWRDAGRTMIVAPAIDPAHPVLHSTWTLHLPEGFAFRDFKTELEPAFKIETPLVIGRVIKVVTAAFTRPLSGLGPRLRRIASRVAPAAEPSLPRQQAIDALRRPEVDGVPRPATAPIEAGKAEEAPGAAAAPAASAAEKEKRFGDRMDQGGKPVGTNLVPLTLELPRHGTPHRFEGAHAPTGIAFTYLDLTRQTRLVWLWIALGVFGFVLWQARRPWMKFLWGLLVLSFAPLCFSMSITPACNGLLIGWTIMFALDRVAVRFGLRRDASEDPLP